MTFKSPIGRFEVVSMTFERPTGLQNVLTKPLRKQSGNNKNYTCICFLYSEGENPVSFLKVLIKLLFELKPQS